jgi:pyruvate formate lyase activating enzyme
VWIEVTTLIVPGLNDTVEELTRIAEFVRSVGPEVPWHVSAFYPAYRMTETPPTSIALLRRARAVGLAVELRSVYEGNVPGAGGENTYCPQCGALLIERYGFFVRANRIREGRCPDCQVAIDGKGMSHDEPGPLGLQ